MAAVWLGYNLGKIQACYNTGAVSGKSNVGGVAGYNGDGTVSDCYYCGYSGGVGQKDTTAAVDVADGTIPFVSCENTLNKGDTAAIPEQALTGMKEDFKAAFGITAVQYPDEYTSSNTNFVQFSKENGKKILTGVAQGSATVNGNVVISQKALTSEGFNGAEMTVDGTVHLPVTVSDKTQITAFSIRIDDNSYDGTIDKDKHTIAVTVPSGTDVTKLTAKFEASTDTTVTVGSTKQESGETVNDFTKPVTYIVKTDDDSSQKYKVTVTILSDHSDSGSNGSSHHHSHSTTTEKPKKQEPKTETKVDSKNNTASIAAVVSDVRQSGNAAEMQISVPTVTVDTSDNSTALDLSKNASVTVELPKNDIVQQINSGKSVYVDLTLPSDAKEGKSSNLSVSINAAKEILEAAKDHAQDVTLSVRYAGDQKAAYTLTLKGSDLAKSSVPIKDMDMGVKIMPTKSDSKIDSITQKNKGIVVRFSSNGTLPAAATLKFSAQVSQRIANL